MGILKILLLLLLLVVLDGGAPSWNCAASTSMWDGVGRSVEVSTTWPEGQLGAGVGGTGATVGLLVLLVAGSWEKLLEAEATSEDGAPLLDSSSRVLVVCVACDLLGEVLLVGVLVLVPVATWRATVRVDVDVRAGETVSALVPLFVGVTEVVRGPPTVAELDPVAKLRVVVPVRVAIWGATVLGVLVTLGRVLVTLGCVLVTLGSVVVTLGPVPVPVPVPVLGSVPVPV